MGPQLVPVILLLGEVIRVRVESLFRFAGVDAYLSDFEEFDQE